MAEQNFPHIRDDYAPLDTLIKSAIRRFGDFSPQSVDGVVTNMFIEFANMVIEDYRSHPYYDGRKIEYYKSANEARPIPDQIMLLGLLAHYSFQQMSEKTPGYQAMYFKAMNQIMWHDINGNTAIKMRPMDGGSNKDGSSETSVTNGLTDEELKSDSD
jgi:hypothetical protein